MHFDVQIGASFLLVGNSIVYIIIFTSCTEICVYNFQVIFCSETCRKKAINFHSVECNHMMNLAQFACTNGPYLAYRMITNYPLDYFLQRKELINDLQNASVSFMRFDFMGPLEIWI